MSDQIYPYSLQAVDLPKGLLQEVKKARNLAEQIVKEKLRARTLDWDRAMESGDLFPTEAMQLINENQLLSKWLPKVFGGGGWNSFSLLPFNEVLASECLGFANLLGAHYVAVSLLSASLNFSALRRITKEIKLGEERGEPCFLSAAITEPAAGTDLEDFTLVGKAKIEFQMQRTETGFLLKGSKVFISNSSLAKWHVVVGYENPSSPQTSVVILLVPANSSGITIGRQEQKMGQHLCPASEIHFDSCIVPWENVVFYRDQFGADEEFRDHCQFLLDDVLSLSRAGVGALGAGSAQGVLFETVRLCKEKKLLQEEWVQAVLAEMHSHVQRAKNSYWEANYNAAKAGPYRDMQKIVPYYFFAWAPRFLLEKGIGPLLISSFVKKGLLRSRRERKGEKSFFDLQAQGSSAKLLGSDAAMENCRLAISLLGLDAVRKENRLEKHCRDAKLLQIYEGTNVINQVNLFKNSLALAHPDVEVFS